MVLSRNCFTGSFLYLNLLTISDNFFVYDQAELNVLMESKGGKKSSSSKSLFYEAPLGYSIEDVRPNGGIKKFRSAAYSNVSFGLVNANFMRFLFLSIVRHDCESVLAQ